ATGDAPLDAVVPLALAARVLHARHQVGSALDHHAQADLDTVLTLPCEQGVLVVQLPDDVQQVTLLVVAHVWLLATKSLRNSRKIRRTCASVKRVPSATLESILTVSPASRASSTDSLTLATYSAGSLPSRSSAPRWMSAWRRSSASAAVW